MSLILVIPRVSDTFPQRRHHCALTFLQVILRSHFLFNSQSFPTLNNLIVCEVGAIESELKRMEKMKGGRAAKLIVDALLQRFLPLARRRIETAQAQVQFLLYVCLCIYLVMFLLKSHGFWQRGTPICTIWLIGSFFVTVFCGMPNAVQDTVLYWITRFVVIGNGNMSFLLLCAVIELKEGLKIAKILSSQAQYICCKAKNLCLCRLAQDFVVVNISTYPTCYHELMFLNLDITWSDHLNIMLKHGEYI